MQQRMETKSEEKKGTTDRREDAKIRDGSSQREITDEDERMTEGKETNYTGDDPKHIIG